MYTTPNDRMVKRPNGKESEISNDQEANCRE